MPPRTRSATDDKSKVSSGDLVVLSTGFVARTSADNPKHTHRYGRGEKFEPVDGVHDVEHLIALKAIGRVGDKDLRASTALDMSKAAAHLHQENSPVIDLQAQPFEVTDPDADADEDSGSNSGKGSQ